MDSSQVLVFSAGLQAGYDFGWRMFGVLVIWTSVLFVVKCIFKG